MSEIKENPARPEGEGGEKMLKRMNKSHEPLRNFGFSKLPWRPDMRILDVGCGEGYYTASIFQALTAAGAESVAVVGFATSRQNRTLPAKPGIPFDLDAEPDEPEDF